MKTIAKKNEMVNRIKYNTSAFWMDNGEYFSFEAKWDSSNSVYFRIKSIIDNNGSRSHYYKKGILSYSNSRYFISLVNSIDFKKFKKDSKNVNDEIIDGENNDLKVKTDKYCGKIYWQTDALESEYIRTIKTLVRICEKHKDQKVVLPIIR